MSLGVKRFQVMYNDFVLVGPKSDPAGIKGKKISLLLLGRLLKRASFSFRAATNPAPTQRNSRFGKPRTWTLLRQRHHGTAKLARAWARP